MFEYQSCKGMGEGRDYNVININDIQKQVQLPSTHLFIHPDTQTGKVVFAGALSPLLSVLLWLSDSQNF